MGYFYGNWQRTFDKKGRIAVPPGLKKNLGRKVIVVQEGNVLCVYPEGAPLKQKPSNILIAEIKSSGRMSFPIALVESIFDTRKATWYGMKDHVEIAASGKGEPAQLVKKAVRNIRSGANMLVGQSIPTSEITVAQAVELDQYGVSSAVDGDNKKAVLQKKKGGSNAV